MEILRMTPADAEAAAEIEALCFSEPWSAAAFLESLKSPAARFFVAREQGRVVGWAGMHTAAGESYIDNIAVHPDFRRRGAGGALLSALISAAAGGQFITLEVRETNAAAIALYTAHGFLPVGTRRNFYKNPTENALLMTRSF